jgi:WD40 repeat protein
LVYSTIRSIPIITLETYVSGRNTASQRINCTREIQGKSLKWHVKDVYCCAWSPDGQTLASASYDQTVRIWNTQTGQEIILLEGHTESTSKISFSHDSRLLASSSTDGEIRLWNTKTWETVSKLRMGFHALAFNPHTSLLTTGGQLVDEFTGSKEICIWSLDFASLLGTTPVIPSAHYTNAKVVFDGRSETDLLLESTTGVGR